MRLFTAILLSDDARRHLDEMGDRAAQAIRAEITCRSPSKPDIKWVAVENLHVTLKFLGDVEEELLPDLIERLGAQVPALPPGYVLRATGLALIPPARGPIRVVAASVGDDVDPLMDIYGFIERTCEDFGVARERRAFLPHITLARCRHPVPAEARYEVMDCARFTPGPWFDASQFALVQSTLKPDGPEYRTIATFPAA